LKGLSRVKGNFHARFLGGEAVAILPSYPIYTLNELISHEVKKCLMNEFLGKGVSTSL
jgi:hypothetical protein